MSDAKQCGAARCSVDGCPNRATALANFAQNATHSWAADLRPVCAQHNPHVEHDNRIIALEHAQREARALIHHYEREQGAYETKIERLERQVATLRAQIVHYCADDPPHARECAVFDPEQHGPCDCGVEQWVADARASLEAERTPERDPDSYRALQLPDGEGGVP